MAAETGSVDISFNLISHGDVQGTPLVEMTPDDFAAYLQHQRRHDRFNDQFFQEPSAPMAGPASPPSLSNGWSLTPPEVQVRFVTTQGLDRLFRTVDVAVPTTAKLRVGSYASSSPAADALIVGPDGNLWSTEAIVR